MNTEIEFKIICEPKPSLEDTAVINKGVSDYARQQKNMDPVEPFAFFVKDKNGKILAGCSGAFIYGCMHVGNLWVIESLRKQGIGTQLLKEAEKLAREKECTLATLNTMDWGARELYEKLGYKIDHSREGYKNHSTFYFLKKELT